MSDETNDAAPEPVKDARGGRRTGAGRPKGTKNKKTLAREALTIEALKGGMTPLEYKIHLFRKYIKNSDEKSANEIATELMPYLHPRLSAVETKLDGYLQTYEAQKIPVHTRDSDAIGTPKGNA